MSEKAKLYAKMASVMEKMSRVPKSGHNDHFNYDYATSEDVADAVRVAMAEAGIAFFVDIIQVQQEGKKTTTDFEFTFADSETGETRSCLWRGEAIDGQDKGISKSATSAVKYFLLKTFLISTGDEPDPDAGDKQEQKTSAKSNGKRPYKPEYLKGRISEFAGKYSRFIPTENQQKALRMALLNVFAGDDNADDKRHMLLNYLTGTPSTKEVTGPIFKAIYEDWLQVSEDDDGIYHVNEMAIKEANAIITQALKDEGQAELL